MLAEPIDRPFEGICLAICYCGPKRYPLAGTSTLGTSGEACFEVPGLSVNPSQLVPATDVPRFVFVGLDWGVTVDSWLDADGGELRGLYELALGCAASSNVASDNRGDLRWLTATLWLAECGLRSRPLSSDATERDRWSALARDVIRQAFRFHDSAGDVLADFAHPTSNK